MWHHHGIEEAKSILTWPVMVGLGGSGTAGTAVGRSILLTARRRCRTLNTHATSLDLADATLTLITHGLNTNGCARREL